ncbi:MAG: hypothetical protein IPM82_06115 [Saprospiraceae bacterium]|nr:hypothetical protein [Saprospiraceae bacterium]
MKKAFTLLVFCWAMVSQLVAQIPQNSPIPVDVLRQSQRRFSQSFGLHLGASDWGDTLLQTIIAPIAWAQGIDSLGNETDSLACDSMAVDLTGKIALIRRGTCEFGWKALRAQEAGAIAVIITNWVPLGQTIDGVAGGIPNMGAGALGTTVTIPARGDGDIISEKLDAGIPVTGYLHRSADRRSSFSLCTTKLLRQAIKPLSDIGVTFLNIDAVLRPSLP